MSKLQELQEKLDGAFNNYFPLSDILRNDMLVMLQSRTDSQQWRRNYIRVAASLIEGYSFAIREISAVGLLCNAPEITAKQTKVLQDERSFETADRIKHTLCAAYKLFGLLPTPNFGGTEWRDAQVALEKRHLLMHPKCAADLEIASNAWDAIEASISWLIEQHMQFFSALHTKHVG